MRTYVNGDIYNSLPSDLKVGIIDTLVVSGHGQRDSANFTSTDKLYLLSPGEVWSGNINYDSAISSTRQLDYYGNLGVTISNKSGAVKKLNGSAYHWSLRTAKSNDVVYFHSADSSGNWNSAGDAYDTLGTSPAFRIG